MDKTYISYFPFSISAETKTSKAGKPYTSIGICQKSKDKEGNEKKTYFNLIDERELLILASACENMYHRIVNVRNEEFKSNKTEETTDPVQDSEQFEPKGDWSVPCGSEQTTQTEFNDEIPF